MSFLGDDIMNEKLGSRYKVMLQDKRSGQAVAGAVY
jgi:hypothetical protein